MNCQHVRTVGAASDPLLCWPFSVDLGERFLRPPFLAAPAPPVRPFGHLAACKHLRRAAGRVRKGDVRPGELLRPPSHTNSLSRCMLQMLLQDHDARSESREWPVSGVGISRWPRPGVAADIAYEYAQAPFNAQRLFDGCMRCYASDSTDTGGENLL